MFPEHERKKTTFQEWLRRFLFLLSAVLVLVVSMIIFQYMSQVPSTKQKKAMATIKEKKESFLESINISVIETGYQKRISGVQTIYVPKICVQISNISAQKLKDFRLGATFSRNGNMICRDSVPVNNLMSLETRELYLRCIQSIGFGSVIRGLSLGQTSDDVNYDIWATSGGFYIQFLKGKLHFSLWD
jgi:hypothetical protein